MKWLHSAGEKECRTSRDFLQAGAQTGFVLGSSQQLLVQPLDRRRLWETLLAGGGNADRVSERNRGCGRKQLLVALSRSSPEARSPHVSPLWSVWLQRRCVAPAPSAAPSPEWLWKTTATLTGNFHGDKT